MKNKKAQLEIGEKVIVMFFFFALLIFGLVFYMRIQGVNLARQKDYQNELKAAEIAVRAAFFLPVQCSAKGAQNLALCYDYLKLKNISSITNSSQDYFRTIFARSEIVVRDVYPHNSSQWVVYNNTPVNIDDYTQHAYQLPLPILVSNETVERYWFGQLDVRVFSPK